MPKYRVHVTQTVIEYAAIEVEADSPEAASRKAEEADMEGRLQWEWHDCMDFEIAEVEELQLRALQFKYNELEHKLHKEKNRNTIGLVIAYFVTLAFILALPLLIVLLAI